jgi:hypothetical protein
VRESKLVLWLQEDVLQRRHAPPKTRKKRRTGKTSIETPPEASPSTSATKDLADEAKELSETLGAPLEEALAMLIDDRIAPTVPGDEGEPVEGALLQYSTIEVYVAAVMELWQTQVSAGWANTVSPRTDAVGALIAQRRRDRAQIARESYADRGGHGYDGGYTARELKNMQSLLLQDQHDLVSPPLLF